MKRINFTKLTIKNFLSVGNEPVTVKFKNGLNLIRGINRDEEDIANAAGKSSVIAAFYFAIFGEPLVELPNKFLINRKIGKGAVIRLEFEDISSKRGEEYFVIERTLGPNKCRIWKNDIEKTKSSIAETNKYILEVLDADDEIFRNCIVMRANSGTSFMTKKKTEKKNFIESIFNLGVFSEMLKLVKDDVREKRSDFDIENSALSVMNENVEHYKTKIAEIEKQIEEQQQKIAIEKQRLEDCIKKEEEKIALMEQNNAEFDPSILNKQTENMRKVNEYDKELTAKIGGLAYELKAIKEQISAINKIGNACPKCKRAYDEGFVNDNAKMKVELMEKAKAVYATWKENEAKQQKLAKSKTNTQKIIDQQKKLENEIKVNKVRINSAKTSINQFRQMIEKVEEQYAISPINAFVQSLAETEAKANEKKSIVNEIQKSLGRMNVAEHILGEGGVRSQIVNMLLELLNGRIRYYLKSFKSTFEFTFNEVFEEIIKDVHGVICMYNNCSGAEMKKIDLAIAFAFLDIIKLHRHVEYNVVFYDEILDSSVDNKSLEHIISFIAERANVDNKSVYVVTHKTDIILPQLTETVLLEKRNGFTRRIEA
ncbi:MAG: hypothetical protein J6R59_00020 [Paludibacteraceae bacterium]|nr:hypothetical protein [Paludibacteraceae bacterium]